MAQPPISTCIQQVVTLTTSYTATVVDQHDPSPGSRTATFGTGSTNTYWRIYLASGATPSTPSTTSTAPKSLVAHFEAKLNAGSGGGNYWHVAVNSSGYVTVRYTGTGTGTITWVGTVIRNLLGFDTNISCASGATQTATYHPTHNIYAVSRVGDNGPLIVPSKAAASVNGLGVVSAWRDTSRRIRRRFDLRFHPYDWSAFGTLGASATPLWGDSTRWYALDATAGVTYPWGLNDFFGTCHGQPCGALFGTFQSVISGSVSTCDTVYITPDAFNAPEPTSTEQPNNTSWHAWKGVSLYRTGSESL